MSVNFEFDAPQFLNTSDDPEADKFFDIAVEASGVKQTIYSPQIKAKDYQEIENHDPHAETNVIESKETEKSPTSRKVLNELINQQSPNDPAKTIVKQKVASGVYETNLIESLEKLTLKTGSCKKTRIPLRQTEIFEGIQIERPIQKKHSMMTRLDSLIKTPVLKLRSRPVPLVNMSSDNSAESSEKCSPTSTIPTRKSAASKRRGSPLSGRKKFISLAERIQHFHYDTPDRFRTIPKQQIVPQNIKLRQTIPKTPALSARYRHRPVNFPDEKEREEMELKEMKKHQVKAYPLNEKILKGPVLNLKAPVEKKPTTVPEPFKLSEGKKKEQPESPLFVFKAHPLRSSIMNGPVGVPPKKVVKATVPVTPKIKVPLRFTNLHCTPIHSSGSDQSLNNRTTKVQPFSFDQRIKESLQKKEETIKKVIEEEKKAFSSFRAQPLPNYLGRCIKTHNNSLYKSEMRHNPNNTTYSIGSKREGDTPFKARPATVVHQKPFVPVLQKHEPIFPENVNLNTEKRATERQKFDEKLKEKEEIQSQLLKERKEEEEKLEEQKRLEERKLTEFKAKPVPKFKPFEIVPADPSYLTVPKTPKCLSKNKNTNNESIL